MRNQIGKKNDTTPGIKGEWRPSHKLDKYDTSLDKKKNTR
jgi:hypothetical protein